MIFWISAIALLALALAILLIPMLRASKQPQDDQRQQQNIQIAREKKQQLEQQLADAEIDQAAFDSAYLDLQTSLALDLDRADSARTTAPGRWMIAVVLLAIPVASVSMYLMFGEYRIIENPQLAQAPTPTAHQAGAGTAPQMSLDEMQTAVKERLRENPEDAEGWFMLGRVMMAKQFYNEAVTSFQRSHDLLKNEPGIMFALADALAMQNDGNLLGEPEELIMAGLKLAPQFPNGLWLAGMAAEQREDYKAAHRYWTQLLPLISDNPSSTQEIKGLIALLEQRDPDLMSTVNVGTSINLVVDINAELKARAPADAVVFVYAKAMQGPPMPLAVRKMKVGDLPVSLSLSDDDAMMPSMRLSSFNQIIVGARVSTSGNPVAQSGDFYTEIDSIARDNPPPEIRLTIDQVK